MFNQHECRRDWIWTYGHPLPPGPLTLEKALLSSCQRVFVPTKLIPIYKVHAAKKQLKILPLWAIPRPASEKSRLRRASLYGLIHWNLADRVWCSKKFVETWSNPVETPQMITVLYTPVVHSKARYNGAPPSSFDWPIPYVHWSVCNLYLHREPVLWSCAEAVHILLCPLAVGWKFALKNR